MRPWQEYLMSVCPPDSFKSMPDEARAQSAQWRFADWAAFNYDVMDCYGPVAATCLSMAYRPKVVVEFGVFSGHTALVLCRCNPEAQVYGVDSRGLCAGTNLPIGYTALLHGADNLDIQLGNSWDFSMPGKVDLCFIDADHGGNAPYLDSVRAWDNRNAAGNWCIAWDDYHPSNPDVVRAVDCFVAEVGMELHKLMSWQYIGTLPHSAVEAFL